MTDTQPRQARGPADLLALVPSLFGFHPEESLVLLTVGDTPSPFHARVDLPVDPVGIERLGEQLTETAQRNRTSRVAVVAYTDDAGLAHAVVDDLADRLGGIGVELVCAVRADGGRWWAMPAWPDEEGTPYDVRSHPWMAQAVLDGTTVLGSRQELADSLVGNDPEETERIGATARELATGLDGSDLRELVLEGRWLRRRIRQFVADRGRLDAHDVARLSLLVGRSIDVRDVAWAEITHANAAEHVDLWRDVVRRTSLELRAPAAALLGFAAWLSGDGALAWCAVERAQEAEPGYSLASLLTQVLAGALPPSSWEPIPHDSLGLFNG
jgi:hypothetical protein